MGLLGDAYRVAIAATTFYAGANAVLYHAVRMDPRPPCQVAASVDRTVREAWGPEFEPVLRRMLPGYLAAGRAIDLEHTCRIEGLGGASIDALLTRAQERSGHSHARSASGSPE